jgi:hypothetical protein
MIELPLVFLGGLLGSAHCVGMCGGFALMIGAGSRGWAANVGRQMVYSLGRIFTYAVFGGALGYAGLRLTEDLPSVLRAQAALALLAGVLLVIQGLASAGVLHRGMLAAIVGRRDRGPLTLPQRPPNGVPCLATGMLGTLLRAPGLGHVLLAGMVTGFLPCGLVYAFLALAASSSGLLPGLATMLAFGSGTVPLMVLAGSGASALSIAMRQRLYRAAAWCVVLTGLLSLARGAGVLDFSTGPAATGCPLCRSAE